LVNGEKIFVKGSNWVPLDGLHSRDKQHLSKMFDMLNDLNCNMVRCWGGNVYEDDEFYDLCDRNGIMVWQDFALGCARYPQNDEFAAWMETEARFIVKKFRNRASLAIWAGDNEIDVSRTWIVNMTQHDPNLDRISRSVLPGVVRDQDPVRDYLPSSPYVSPEVFKAGFNLKMMPEVHLWGPRGYYKQVEALFGTLPDRFDDFIFASQATQAEAKKFFIEFWRSQKFQKTGILWWNLRDGWPILSDAIVDYYFSEKLAYDYIKRAQTDVCTLITDAKNGRHPVVVVNDTLKPARGKVSVVQADSGQELFHSDFSVEANGKTTAGHIPEIGSHEMWLIHYELEDGSKHLNHYLSGKAPFKLEDYKRWFGRLKINDSFSTNSIL